MNNDSRNTLLRRASIGGAFILAAAGVLAAVDTGHLPKNSIDLRRDDTPINRTALEPDSFAGLVKRVAPSIVKVTVEIKPRTTGFEQGGFPGFDDPALRQFFGGHLPQVQQGPEAGLGSGVIISSNGYIVTNNHVVEGARDVVVTLSDGREFPARVVGRDPQTDVAVIKISASDLPAITFAPSHNVEVGDRVLAIGNPFGIGETVTSGIVSGTGRRAGIGLKYEDFIQTDAAINPGNSGGALVDIDGRLVGMNTAILSRSGGFQGVGLAVPSDLVSNVAQTLVTHGKVVRGYIGIGIQDLTPALADSFGIKATGGALISDVQPDSPGARAGLRSGDVVTAINGQPVLSASNLSLTVGENPPGTRMNLQILRDGRTQQVAVTTIVKGSSDGRIGAEDQQSGQDQGVLNGVAVGDIDSNARAQLGLPDRISGALITGVDPSSASARAGLQQGDVILEINHHPVTNAQSAVDLSASATGKKTLVKVWTHGNTVYVLVDESQASQGGNPNASPDDAPDSAP